MAQYRIPVEETFSWQRPVIATQNTPPGTPSKGDRYIVGTSPTGDWAGHANNIAWYDGSQWKFDTPSEGWAARDKAEDKFKYYDGSAWQNWAGGDMYKSTYDTDNDGIVDKAESIDDGAGNSATAAQIKDAVDKKHSQNTDTYLDYGGSNQISAAQAKEAYTRRGQWDSDLECILMEI